MLFWIFVIALIIGRGCWIVGCKMCDRTKYDTGWLAGTGVVITVVMVAALLVNCVAIANGHLGVEANVAKNKQRYESLTYQLENNLYDNDNDLGKKELYDQIREWNEDLAYYQEMQDDFWLGIYHPNVFDQFDFIELPKGE